VILRISDVHVQRSFRDFPSRILIAVDPRFLRTFAAVVRLRSFSAAARELGYTQSAVSQHIAGLEAELGATLLQRRPVAPTEAGTRLLEHAGAILLRLDAARADVARAVAEAPGRLVVGATPLSAPLAARAVAAARRSRPPMTVAVRVAAREAIAIAVATGELDAGIVDGAAAPGDPLPLPETGVPVAAFAEEPLAVAVARDHALAGRRAVALEDLVDARWIDAPGVATPLPALAMLARADGFRPALRYDGLDVAGLLALVEHGEGIALLPASAVAHGVALSAPPLVHRTELLAVDVDEHPEQAPALVARVFAEAAGA
jgi:DNA-binding transcriptional LysR family regulator